MGASFMERQEASLENEMIPLFARCDWVQLRSLSPWGTSHSTGEVLARLEFLICDVTAA